MRPLPIAGPQGILDARLHGPPEGLPVLLLHPHPQMGGSMGSRFVYDLAQALAGAGYQALRFDFRGVGRSEGTYGRGPGEVEDATAAFDHLAALTGRSPAVVGYSFGGAVALRLAANRLPLRLIVVGVPIHLGGVDLDPLTDAAAARAQVPPVQLVVGEHDGFVSVGEAHTLAQRFQPPAVLRTVPDAAHFLEPSRNPAGIRAVLAGLS